MESLERQNLKQIEDLNQRGGRMLTLVDLLQDGTVDLDLAAFLFREMLEGASFLTAANPNGVGKTTLMGAMLNLLRPGTRIKLFNTAPSRTGPGDLWLAHELGRGPYYGYLWGAEVSGLFSVLERGAALASCLHADTLSETKEALLSPPLAVSGEHFAALDLILFMRMEGWRSPKRRVSHVYAADAEGGHQLLFRWEQESDTFNQERQALEVVAERRGLTLEEMREQLTDCRQLVEQLAANETFRLNEVRREVLGFCRDTSWMQEA